MVASTGPFASNDGKGRPWERRWFPNLSVLRPMACASSSIREAMAGRNYQMLGVRCNFDQTIDSQRDERLGLKTAVVSSETELHATSLVVRYRH
jgi:hypothetical protein